MRRAHLIMGMVICFAVLSGCTKKACERYCSCDKGDMAPFDSGFRFASVDPDSPDCEEDCESAVAEEAVSCRIAFRRYARCMDQVECEQDECEDRIDDMNIECSF